MVHMHLLSSASCKLLDGCLTTTAHRNLAWSFVVIFLGVVAAATLQRSARRGTRLLWRTQSRQDTEPCQDGIPPGPRTLPVPRTPPGPAPKQAPAYTYAQSTAENIKAVIQMTIGVITVSVVGWRFLYAPGPHPAQLILEGIGVGLAAAAALELAYTLFTPGPY